jgi:hypothetical protein
MAATALRVPNERLSRQFPRVPSHRPAAYKTHVFILHGNSPGPARFPRNGYPSYEATVSPAKRDPFSYQQTSRPMSQTNSFLYHVRESVRPSEHFEKGTPALILCDHPADRSLQHMLVHTGEKCEFSLAPDPSILI